MIVIPMVGASSRFFKAGYKAPKYQLPLWGETVFFWVMSSFYKYFESHSFVFILRDEYDAKDFVATQAKALGIVDFSIVVLEHMTQGQAETVAEGVKQFDLRMPITIFNIDTIRYDFELPCFADSCGGYLEVFRGLGDHWSFVEPGAELRVEKTAEKNRISDLCSNGLYHFSSINLFLESFSVAVNEDDKVNGEFYIAPLYNYLIKMGVDVRYLEVECSSIDFCGTPEEYEHLKARGPKET